MRFYALKKHFGIIPIPALIEDELAEAERKLLEAETGLNWAESQVAYQRARIARLKAKQLEDWSKV
jgi:hypothetical protein